MSALEGNKGIFFSRFLPLHVDFEEEEGFPHEWLRPEEAFIFPNVSSVYVDSAHTHRLKQDA